MISIWVSCFSAGARLCASQNKGRVSRYLSEFGLVSLVLEWVGKSFIVHFISLVIVSYSYFLSSCISFSKLHFFQASTHFMKILNFIGIKHPIFLTTEPHQQASLIISNEFCFSFQSQTFCFCFFYFFFFYFKFFPLLLLDGKVTFFSLQFFCLEIFSLFLGFGVYIQKLKVEVYI